MKISSAMSLVTALARERRQAMYDTTPGSRARVIAVYRYVLVNMLVVGVPLYALLFAALWATGNFVHFFAEVVKALADPTSSAAILVGSATSAGMGFLFLNRVTRKHRASRIKRAPGMSTNAVLKCLFSKKLHERVFEPVLADMQVEFYEALVLGETRKAQWIRGRGVALLIVAAAAQLPVSLINIVVRLWKAAS